MMNDEQHEGLGYDPNDQASFPYQSNNPPFSAADLVLDPSSLEAAPDLSIDAYLDALPTFSSSSRYRSLDMGLRLFVKMTQDPAFNDIAYPDLLAASLDTAFIWEFG